MSGSAGEASRGGSTALRQGSGSGAAGAASARLRTLAWGVRRMHQENVTVFFYCTAAAWVLYPVLL